MFIIISVQYEYLDSTIKQDVTLCPKATLDTIHFKFTPETVVSYVLIGQVCWQAAPNTWPSNSEAPVTKCVCVEWHMICQWMNGADV